MMPKEKYPSIFLMSKLLEAIVFIIPQIFLFDTFRPIACIYNYFLDKKWNIHMITQFIEICSSDFKWLMFNNYFTSAHWI